MTRRRPSAARLCRLVATVVVAVAAVVGLPAVTWATGPGSQCEATSAGTDPAAPPGDCEPAPAHGEEGDAPEIDPAADEPAPEPAPVPEPELVPDPELPTVSGLSLEASAEPEVVAPGRTVTFAIHVHNAGPADDAEVTVLEAIPAGALVQSGVRGLDPVSGSLSLGAMPVGDSRTVRILVRMPLALGEVVTSPQVAGQYSEALIVEHQDSVVVAVVPPAEVPPAEVPADIDPAVPHPQSESAPDVPAATGAAGSVAGPAVGAEPDAQSSEPSRGKPGDGSSSEVAGVGSSGITGRHNGSADSLRPPDSQRPTSLLGGRERPWHEPTAEPLQQGTASPTSTALATPTGAVVNRAFGTPPKLLGLALLATGGVLLAVGGLGPVRIRRR